MIMAGIDDDPGQVFLPRWTPSGSIADAEDVATAPLVAVAGEPWLGRVFDGRFEILEAIGRGGMATVYRARESGLISREVAIKLLSRESSQDQAVVARFRREAQLITDIHHPHVVHVFHVGRAEDLLYIVMELLRGQSLQATLQAHHHLPWSRVAPMMLNVCAALQAAHEHKITHRDIKPSNCFRVNAAGNPDFIKVLDFGIAKAKQLPHSLVEGTREGTFLGTPHYAAPELIDPRGGPVDDRVDMYALGVMMYQCLAGSLPFAGTRGAEALHHTVHSRPETLRERAPDLAIPTAVDALVMRTISRRPEERFADMADLAEAIRQTTNAPARGRGDTTRAGVIDDRTPPRMSWRVLKTHADTPPHGTLGVDPTPPPQPQVSGEDPPDSGQAPTRPHGSGRRQAAATLLVMALGVLLLGALLGHDALVPDADAPRVTVPLLPPSSEAATTTDAQIVLLAETSSTTDGSTDGTTTDAAPAGAEDRLQAILAEVRALPLPQFVLKCGIGIYDPWKLQVRLRVATDGSVTAIQPLSRTLAPPLRKCLLDAIRAHKFSRGDAVVEVISTIRGGP